MLSLLAGTVQAAPSAAPDDFKTAVSLYNHGMYEKARSMFEVLSTTAPTALTEGYEVLCAIQMNSEGYDALVRSYENKYVNSPLYPQINYLYGSRLFDMGYYESASERFSKVPEGTLGRKDATEMLFRQAYSDFGQEKYSDAKQKFTKLERYPFSDLTAPSRYALGYIAYNDNDFKTAYGWFEQSAKDPRFTDISLYYMLECRFMQKDYSYVTENADAVYSRATAERRPHLARIISEAFLVMGDPEKAKAYYDENSLSTSARNRSDYFYAGSLEYALGQYQSAIDNFTQMTERTDSIGQIANYQLGYSYIQTKNKVEAFNSFGQAASSTYDDVIREDAYFNYAKLAFDINHDVSVFTDYLERYPKTSKAEMIYGYIAQGSLINHDYAAAVAAYDNIDELDGEMKFNYMKANYLRASQLIESGSYRDAVPYLRASTFYTSRLDNFNKLARYWLAECYYKTENYSEAAKIYTDLYNLSALEDQPEGRALTYNVAYSEFKQGDYESAAKMFDKYISSGATDYRTDARIRRADCDFLSKDYKAAIENYLSVVDTSNDPDVIYPYYQLGMSYGLAGKVKDKVAALSRVKEASPESPMYAEALYELGRAYVAAKNEKEAVKSFESLSKTSKDSSYVAKSLIELGLIARNGKQSDKAIGYYKQVAEQFKNTEYSADALMALESLYQSKGEPDVYLAYVQELGGNTGKTEAEKEQIYFGSAEQIFLSENYEKALASLNKYLTAYPEGKRIADAYFYTAECYKALGQKEKACDYYDKVNGMMNKGSYAEQSALNYATLSYGLERYADAYKGYSALAQIAQLEENRAAAGLGMMRSAYKAKDYQNAISCAEALASDKKSSEAVIREADYTSARSYLATSHRDEAYAIFRALSAKPSTDEGAEAAYLIIQDTYDKGDFGNVQEKVYKFAAEAGGQNYWLAKAYIVLGDAFMEQDNVKQAKSTFESLLNGYTPERGSADDVLDNVKMRLKKIEDYE